MRAVGTFRQTLRELRRAPGFAITVVATLVIGAGLTTAIFTIVDAVLLRPLGYRDADRIVALESRFLLENRSVNKIGGDDYNDVARDIRGLEVTAYYNAYSDGVVVNGSAVFLPIAYASPRFGDVLGVAPAAGRLFRTDSDADDEALASAHFAREHFGSARAALGQPLDFEGKPRVIVGVLPDGFDFPQGTTVWFKGPFRPDISARSAFNQRAIGRRRTGVSAAQLAEELRVYSRHLQNTFPDDRNKTIEAVGLQDTIVGSIRPTLRLLMAAVTLVLLIVTVNLTHLQLVRGTQQLRATTVRAALGASRKALASRALAEAVVLALAGAGGAVLLATVTLRLMVRFTPPDLPRVREVHLNAEVLLFSVVVSLAVMVLAAVLPVWHSWHLNPASVLGRGTVRSGEGRGTLRLRNSFVVVQVALTTMLSVAAILLTRQLLAESRIALGYTPGRFAVLDTHSADRDLHGEEAAVLSGSSAELQKAIAARQARALRRLGLLVDAVGATPGVDAAAAVDGAPGGYSSADVRYSVVGAERPGQGGGLPDADVHAITPEFFAAMQVPLLRGRPITAEDRLGAPLTVVVNASLAKQAFADKDPIGRQIRCGLDDREMTPWTIVGVAADIHHGSPAEKIAPAFYIPFAQHPILAGDAQIVARTSSDPAFMLDTLRRRLENGFPDVAIKAATLQTSIGETQQTEKFRTVLLSGFAAVSIALAAVGMYGVTAYSVAQRRFEFGLRLAIGAARSQVLGLVLRRALMLAAAGALLGFACSLGVVQMLGSVLGQLPRLDAISYATAAGLVLLITGVATLAPAASAVAVEPMQVLRNE